nr:MAG TPA: hypothetical protein [Caudoviricetes sp.]
MAANKRPRHQRIRADIRCRSAPEAEKTGSVKEICNADLQHSTSSTSAQLPPYHHTANVPFRRNIRLQGRPCVGDYRKST